MIPSKKLKSNLTNFKNLVRPVFLNKTLSKSKQKYNPHGGENGMGDSSKGVESDQITIFEPIGIKHGIEFQSFAIIFDYIDKKESEYTAQVTIKPINKMKSYFETEHEKIDREKLNDNIIHSEIMTIEQFRLKINELNKILTETDNLTENKIISLINITFMGEKMDLDKTLKEESKKIEIFLKDKKASLGNIEDKYLEVSENLDNAKKRTELSLKRTREYKELQGIKKREKELLNQIDKKRTAFEEKNKVAELKNELMEVENKLKKETNEYKHLEENELQKRPAILRSRLKKSIK